MLHDTVCLEKRKLTTWCLDFFKLTSNLNALIVKNSIDTNKIVKDVSVTL